MECPETENSDEEQKEQKETANEQVPDEILEELVEKLEVQKVPIEVFVEGATDRGNEREHNEDNYVVYNYVFPNHQIRVDVLGVFDGMGGGDAGEVMGHIASQTYMAYMASMLASMPAELVVSSSPSENIFSWLDQAVPQYIYAGLQEANKKILDYGQRNGLKRETYGSTAVVAVAISDLENDHIIVHGWNEGDSRMSWWNDKEFKQITADHTTYDGRIYRFLGQSYSIGGQPLRVENNCSETHCLLLYSDGFSDMVEPMLSPSVATQIEIAKHVETPLEDERAAGDDNITIIKWTAQVIKEPASIETPEKEEE